MPASGEQEIWEAAKQDETDTHSDTLWDVEGRRHN